MRQGQGRIVGMAGAIGLSLQAAAQPDLLWVEQFGTSDNDEGLALVGDGAGGVFVAGYTTGSLGGPNAGVYDAFLARSDFTGDQLWLTQFGTSETEFCQALASDGNGGVFVAGWTDGSIGGPNNGGERDAFLARHDAAGHQAWITQFSTNQTDDFAYALAPDGSGGVFVAGYTYGKMGGQNAGGIDAWLARYDAAGARKWIKQLGTSQYDYAYALAADGNGGVFITGLTNGNLGGPNAGGSDAYLARYDAAGNKAWIKQFGTSDGDDARALAPDGNGGVFVAGITYGSLGGPNAGDGDAFLAQYDDAGKQVWITQFGTSVFDWALALTPDESGGVFVAGVTTGSLGGPHAGKSDAYLARYDAAGNQAWITQFGTSAGDLAYALADDETGGAFIAGTTYGNLGGLNSGYEDVFLARFGEPCYADFTGDGVLDLFDFLGYVNTFNAGDDAADCDGNGPLELFDFLCFVNAFNAGC